MLWGMKDKKPIASTDLYPFKISIDDGFVKYQYTFKFSGTASIGQLIDTFCAATGKRRPKGKLLSTNFNSIDFANG
jgi:hypothetical protein